MKLTIDSQELKTAITGLTKIVTGRSRLPILNALRFDCNSRGTDITGTDLDEYVTYRAKTATVEGQGAFAADAGALKSALKGAGKGPVVLDVTDSAVAGIETPVGSRVVRQPLTLLPVDDFPPMDTDDIPTSKAPEFLTRYQKLVTFASTDSTRYVLNSVCLEVNRGQKFGDCLIATDGRRLGSFNSMCFTRVAQTCILPVSKFLAWPALEHEDIRIGSRKLKSGIRFQLSSPQWDYRVKPIDGTFPSWRQVIPSEPVSHKITISEEDADLLCKVLPGFPGADDKSGAVTIIGNAGKVVIYARGIEDKAWSSLPLTSSSYEGDRQLIAVNRYFLTDALKTGFRRFGFENDLSPLISRDDIGGLHVLMPVRVIVDPEAPEVAPAAPVPVAEGQSGTTEVSTGEPSQDSQAAGEGLATEEHTGTPETQQSATGQDAGQHGATSQEGALETAAENGPVEAGTGVSSGEAVSDTETTKREEQHMQSDTSGPGSDGTAGTQDPETQGDKPQVTRKPRATRGTAPAEAGDAIERINASIEGVRELLKQAATGLGEVTVAVRDVMRDFKAQGKDVEAARATLAKLKGIKL